MDPPFRPHARRRLRRMLRAGVSLAATAMLMQSGAGFAAGAGLVGQRHVSIALEVLTEHDRDYDAVSLTTRYNHPVTPTLDVTFESSHLHEYGLSHFLFDIPGLPPPPPSDEKFLPDQTDQFLVGASLHQATRSGILFASVALGVMQAEFDEDSEIGGAYIVSTGFEIPIGEKLALTPHVSWKDSFSIAGLIGGSVHFGVRGSIRLAEKWDVLAAIETNDDERWAFSMGLSRRW